MVLTARDLWVLADNNPALKAKYPDLFVETQRREKYRNCRVYVYEDGFVSYGEKLENHGRLVDKFDSVKEYERWGELKLLEKAHIIQSLKKQHYFEIQPEGKYDGSKIRKIGYKADFMYQRNGETVVEDVKPFDNKTGKHRTTKDFNLKWKMLKMRYPKFKFELF